MSSLDLGWRDWFLGQLPVVIDDGWLVVLEPDWDQSRTYFPLTEPGVLPAFLDLARSGSAAEREVCARNFVAKYGPLGYLEAVARPAEIADPGSSLWREWQRRRRKPILHQATHADDEWLHKASKMAVEPVQWVLAEAGLLAHCEKVLGAGAAVRGRDLAAGKAAHVVDGRLRHVVRGFDWDSSADGQAQGALTFRSRCLLDALWYLLAERLCTVAGDGRMRLVRCKECGRYIEATDSRVEYCPPLGELFPSGRKRSPCYEKAHQRKLRERRRAQGLTSRGTPRARHV